MKKKIAVIGAGPGGYVAAIRAAQLGADVTIIEKSKLGGVCLNEGCIPTKVLNKHAAVIKDIDRAGVFGINVDGYTIDFAKMISRKDKIVSKLTGGVKALLKRNGVNIMTGEAEIVDRNTVSVAMPDRSVTAVECDNIIVATGAEPVMPPIAGIEHAINSRQLLELTGLPKSLAILGGGVIGIEIASIFNKFGCDVTVMELQDEMLPGMDQQIARDLHKELAQSGINIITSCAVEKIDKKNGELEITGENRRTIHAEKVLMAIGRRPLLPKTKIEIAKNGPAIAVDEYLKTNIPNIYCIGDANGNFQLAHVASAEALVAVSNIMDGDNRKMSYQSVPSVIYSFPEVASVGKTEQTATGCHKGSFPYSINGKAMAMEETTGYIKVLADSEYGEVIGVHILGYDASNIIGEAGLGLNLETTIDEIASTIHAHPSISEILMEACEDVENKAIHK